MERVAKKRDFFLNKMFDRKRGREGRNLFNELHSILQSIHKWILAVFLIIKSHQSKGNVQWILELDHVASTKHLLREKREKKPAMDDESCLTVFLARRFESFFLATVAILLFSLAPPSHVLSFPAFIYGEKGSR